MRLNPNRRRKTSKLDALASPVRQEILELLQRRSYSVRELAKVMGWHSTASSYHHLRLLENADLIRRTPEGYTSVTSPEPVLVPLGAIL